MVDDKTLSDNLSMLKQSLEELAVAICDSAKMNIRPKEIAVYNKSRINESIVAMYRSLDEYRDDLPEWYVKEHTMVAEIMCKFSNNLDGVKTKDDLTRVGSDLLKSVSITVKPGANAEVTLH